MCFPFGKVHSFQNQMLQVNKIFRTTFRCSENLHTNFPKDFSMTCCPSMDTLKLIVNVSYLKNKNMLIFTCSVQLFCTEQPRATSGVLHWYARPLLLLWVPPRKAAFHGGTRVGLLPSPADVPIDSSESQWLL